MPRTKVQKKNVNDTEKNSRQVIAILRAMKEQMIQKNHELAAALLNEECLRYKEEKLLIPDSVMCRTVGEVMQDDFSVTSSNASKLKRFRRSLSLGGDDEGYRTAESTGHSGPRQNRATRTLKRDIKVTRPSRSLSRNNTGNIGQFKTPAKTKTPTTYGTVTPKVNPYVPQTILRRPKMGEMTLSLQGSPLLACGLVPDNEPNINIPLEDGRVFSIQPRTGLRMSQLPHLDPETTRQLVALRENLNTMCADLFNK